MMKYSSLETKALRIKEKSCVFLLFDFFDIIGEKKLWLPFRKRTFFQVIL